MKSRKHPSSVMQILRTLPVKVQQVTSGVILGHASIGIVRDTLVVGNDFEPVPDAETWLVHGSHVAQLKEERALYPIAGTWIVWASGTARVRVIQTITRKQAELLAAIEEQRERSEQATEERIEEHDGRWRRRPWIEEV